MNDFSKKEQQESVAVRALSRIVESTANERVVVDSTSLAMKSGFTQEIAWRYVGSVFDTLRSAMMLDSLNFLILDKKEMEDLNERIEDFDKVEVPDHLPNIPCLSVVVPIPLLFTGGMDDPIYEDLGAAKIIGCFFVPMTVPSEDGDKSPTMDVLQPVFVHHYTSVRLYPHRPLVPGRMPPQPFGKLAMYLLEKVWARAEGWKKEQKDEDDS